MLEFDADQVSTFADAFRRSFVEDTVAFLRARRPDWARAQASGAQEEFVTDTIAFAKAHNLRSAASFQKLALMRIDLPFESDPASYARMLLRAPKWSEARRIAEFDTARRSTATLKRVRLKL